MKKMTTDPKMLELLVCPITRGTLSYNRKTQELISLKAKLAYPIRDGVPIMLASEARPLQNDEKVAYKK
ncbi:Trm112 family protein [Bartonella sp. LB28NMGDW]|uniref:Trm112 family protein n=1 Tax=Bartonella sp. LB28NMGDW TaxID=3243549 RepID=UPI0035D0809B